MSTSLDNTPLGFSFDLLWEKLRSSLAKIKDHRRINRTYELIDILSAAFAMFSLKYTSLLSFEDRSNSEGHNLREIFKIDQICSDTQMREVLDKVSPSALRAQFGLLFKELTKLKVLLHYRYWQDHLIVSIDGVEHFRSSCVHCDQCLTKKHRDGSISYSHSMLAAVLVHPEQAEVFPLDCEPIVQQDGDTKNDCELNAAKRLITHLKAQYGQEKFLLVEDALYSNGPHVEQILAQNWHFLLGVKPDGNTSLFAQVEGRRKRGQLKTYHFKEGGKEYTLQYTNNLALNHDFAHLRVNFLACEEKNAKGKINRFSWIGSMLFSKRNVVPMMKAARARWKIENETFNTLKNQGYHFEHNYGHGKEYLATVLALIMFLAFYIDQIQQFGDTTFRTIWKNLKTKAKLWESLRAVFKVVALNSMAEVFFRIAQMYDIQLE